MMSKYRSIFKMKIKVVNLVKIFIISVVCICFVVLVNGQDKTIIQNEEENKMEKATFAGGCFWCMESPFEELDGVIEVLAGYTGGHKENPAYEEVSTGKTGHLEAVQITYGPSRVSYRQLLEVFWRQIDPTDETGQFTDKGSQYKTAIFYDSEEQK